VWTDGRSGNLDIYAQKLTQNGSAVWIGDGLPICKDLANQGSPRAISDGPAERSWSEDSAAQQVRSADRWFRRPVVDQQRRGGL
jgi:hypothetical protein